MRCCKDLGIASELWDPDFINNWKQQHASHVFAEHVTSGIKKRLWRKNDRELGFPWNETGTGMCNQPRTSSIACMRLHSDALSVRVTI
jgi:hypothetical protein